MAAGFPLPCLWRSWSPLRSMTRQESPLDRRPCRTGRLGLRRHKLGCGGRRGCGRAEVALGPPPGSSWGASPAGPALFIDAPSDIAHNVDKAGRICYLTDKYKLGHSPTQHGSRGVGGPTIGRNCLRVVFLTTHDRRRRTQILAGQVWPRGAKSETGRGPCRSPENTGNSSSA